LLKEVALRKSTLGAMVYRIPITKARVNLGQVVRRVHVNKEYFILEKDGIPVVGLMDADEMEDYLELRDPKVREHIRKSRQDFLAGKSRPAEMLQKELEKIVHKQAAAGRPAPRRRQKA
jgi:PHD/YefM family antitoxin component YafN of YafNO toxin-antitoxin module